MKRTAPMVVVVLALSTMALARSIDFTNCGGTLTGSNAGMKLATSELVAVQGLGSGRVRGDLGAVSFKTGSLKSLGPHGEEIFNGGGSFVITGDGQQGIHNGTIFHGSFVGPVFLTSANLASGLVQLTLRGTVTGQLYGGGIVTAKVEELTVKAGSFGGSIGLLSGTAQTQCKTVVPEPGTLGLLATGLGLVGLAGVVRLKAKA